MGNRGAHTRKKGLDRETNKALLLTHLAKQTGQGAPLSELSEVLPAQPASAVQTLLAELRQEGRVVLRGQRRWGRWHVADAPSLKDGRVGSTLATIFRNLVNL